FGQVGTGSTTTTSFPTPVRLPSVTGTVSMALGAAHTCALRADGLLRCWGSNSSGQIGDGTTTNRASPVSVPGVTDAKGGAAGWERTCALRQNGPTRCRGEGNH